MSRYRLLFYDENSDIKRDCELMISDAFVIGMPRNGEATTVRYQPWVDAWIRDIVTNHSQRGVGYQLPVEMTETLRADTEYPQVMTFRLEEIEADE